MYFRKVIALLLVLVMSLSVVFAVADGNEPIIRDDANLLSEAEQEELRQVMLPVCDYCIPLFWTTDTQDSTDTLSKAQAFLQSEIGDVDGVEFAIDMANRQICVYSSESIYQYITTEVASNITDSIYQYATQGNYLECAKQAFHMILDELNPAGAAAGSDNAPVFEWGISKAESSQIIGGEGKLLSQVEVDFHIGSNGLEAVDYTGLIKRISKFTNLYSIFFYRYDQLVGRYYEIRFDAGEKDFQYLYNALSTMYGQASDSLSEMPDLLLELTTGISTDRESAGKKFSDLWGQTNGRVFTWKIDDNSSVSLLGASNYDKEGYSVMFLFYAHPVKNEYDFYGL